jgi:hypothetical protein
VAQYVLLSESPQIDLSCTIRTGSPAQARFTAEVLYMPKAWVNVHASEINQSSPLGTGEHDYALLVIVGNVDGTPIQTPLPYLPLDTRQGIGFLDDQVLGAGYPAEFAGGLAAQSGLYPVTSISNIKQLLTFTANSIDLFSVGGVIEAQGGSSGGPVINMWGRLIGIITTTSEGATTAERDLRALSLSYINTDIALQSGKDLQTILDGNVMAAADDFRRNSAPGLISEYLEILPH